MVEDLRIERGQAFPFGPAADPESPGRREPAERNRQFGSPDVQRIHSEIPIPQLEEALDQQPRPEEQREAQGHLSGKQRGARARAAGRGEPRRAGLQPVLDVLASAEEPG